MNFIALWLSLGLMVTVWSGPDVPECDPNCKHVTKYHMPDFKHVLELQNSSVAPWSLSVDSKLDREPSNIHYANCMKCTVKHMIAKPIFLQVSVYQRMRNGNVSAWCKCPFKLAVGCTCVRHQDKS